MPRKSFIRLGPFCALCCALGAGAQDEPQQTTIEDTVVLIQKASAAAEGQQFPMFLPGSRMRNPIRDAMRSQLGSTLESALNSLAKDPSNPVASLMKLARSSSMAGLVADAPQPTMRPKAPAHGLNLIVDSADNISLKLTQKMDELGVSAEDFYANTVIIDRFGMRVPQDKVPKPEQYPLIYRYTEPAEDDAPAQPSPEAKTAAEQVFDNVMQMIGGGTSKPMLGNRRERDLAFVIVPSNFKEEIEKAALAVPEPQEADSEAASANLEQKAETTRGPGGELWGQNDEALREKSAVTGCSLHATPPKFWPKELAARYFSLDDGRNRTVTGVLRDPYDKLANEFRLRAEGSAKDRPKYQKLFDACDVNSWVKQELRSAKKDAYLADCRYLPQAEFFDGPYGINLPIDARYMPLSFNEVMERHGYAGIRLSGAPAPSRCSVSAWSFDGEARDMIKEAYARDFALLCRHFGYCDDDEVTCMSHLPDMCGGAPTPAPLPQSQEEKEEVKTDNA